MSRSMWSETRKKPAEAIYDACILRFRPIMMTTMAALLGGLPLALGTGVGSELHRPLGITIVGGLIVSQMLTLFTTPVVYVYLDRLRLALRGGKIMHCRKQLLRVRLGRVPLIEKIVDCCSAAALCPTVGLAGVSSAKFSTIKSPQAAHRVDDPGRETRPVRVHSWRNRSVQLLKNPHSTHRGVLRVML